MPLNSGATSLAYTASNQGTVSDKMEDKDQHLRLSL